ncbi:MAG: hypothetical protein JOZ10_08990 [Acidobacteria bacterium]|nr:hypothetical protein [Acidobacteriota bacterium]
MTQPTLPAEILEKRAAEQRRALHNDVQQLRTVVRAEVRERVDDVKERLDVKKNVARYFGPVAGVTALLALSLGYGLTGVFVD